MFIAKAYAQVQESAVQITSDTLETVPQAPDTMSALGWNVGMVLVLVGLFYVLLIAPQQKRFKEHNKMLSELKKGDKVVTGGGLIGKVEKILDDNEIIIDLGNDMKVTPLRSSLQGKANVTAANDDKKEPKKKDSSKKK